MKSEEEGLPEEEIRRSDRPGGKAKAGRKKKAPNQNPGKDREIRMQDDFGAVNKQGSQEDAEEIWNGYSLEK